MFLTQTGIEFPVTFPEMIEHADIAYAILDRHQDYEIVSAGFCGKTAAVWGKSVGLNKNSRVQDTKIIQNMIDTW